MDPACLSGTFPATLSCSQAPVNTPSSVYFSEPLPLLFLLLAPPFTIHCTHLLSKALDSFAEVLLLAFWVAYLWLPSSPDH